MVVSSAFEIYWPSVFTLFLILVKYLIVIILVKMRFNYQILQTKIILLTSLVCIEAQDPIVNLPQGRIVGVSYSTYYLRKILYFLLIQNVLCACYVSTL